MYTHLIQRLRKPINYQNPFSFGGGLRNGGLSKEAMNLIKGIFSFDYMGAAEFEWGAVPEALDKIGKLASKNKLITGETKKVYYLCSLEQKENVIDIINQLLLDEYKLRLKEYCGLQDYFKNSDEYSNLGWLELNNGFFFFVNKEMFSKTCELFGVKSE